ALIGVAPALAPREIEAKTRTSWAGVQSSATRQATLSSSSLELTGPKLRLTGSKVTQPPCTIGATRPYCAKNSAQFTTLTLASMLPLKSREQPVNFWVS